jgi:hypothetical protein
LPRPFAQNGLTVGPDGNVWATERNDSASDAILRVSPTGATTRFLLPHRESAPEAITPGPDGALWFTEYFGKRIGRITTSGQITEFPAHQRPVGITGGPDGNLWFTAEGTVGRMTPTGDLTEFDLASGSRGFASITTGPDGRLWFLEGEEWIGRISPRGRFSRVHLLRNHRTPTSLTLGPDGAVWFSAAASGTCEGGGLTCMHWIPKRPRAFGRVVPGALGVAVGSRRARVRGTSARVRLRCEEGNGNDVCKGVLALQGRAGAAQVSLGRRRYRLPTDSSHTFAVPLGRSALARLSRRGRLRAWAVASVKGGESSSRGIILAAAPRR